MTNILTSAKTRALNQLIETFSKTDLAADVAPDFTCNEAEAVYNLLLEFGHQAEATAWLNAHALADRHPDTLHYERGNHLRIQATEGGPHKVIIEFKTTTKEKK